MEFPLSQQEQMVPLDLIEYFAGRARICKVANYLDYEARAFDVLYHRPEPGHTSTRSGKPKRSHFDLNGECGFASLDCV